MIRGKNGGITITANALGFMSGNKGINNERYGSKSGKIGNKGIRYGRSGNKAGNGSLGKSGRGIFVGLKLTGSLGN